MFKEGLTAKNISKELNIDLSTVYKLSNEFWNVRFSEARPYLK